VMKIINFFKIGKMEGIVEGCWTTLFTIYFEGERKYDWEERVGKDFLLFGKLLEFLEKGILFTWI